MERTAQETQDLYWFGPPLPCNTLLQCVVWWIASWAELKARFIQNFKDTCKQPMSIVDLDACAQEEGVSMTHWVRRVKAIIHSSDNIHAGSAVLMLEKICRVCLLNRS